MRKRHFSILLLSVIMALYVLPLQVSANGPAPTPWYSIEVQNLPEGVVYVDLLIYLPEDDPMFVELVSENLPDGFSEEAEIVAYCENDYRSYTFHYKDAQSVIHPDTHSIVTFFTDNIEHAYIYDHADDIARRGDVRLAMLDQNGKILKISPLLSQSSHEFMAYSLGAFCYDAETDEWEIEYSISSWGYLLYVLVSIVGVALTCFLETAISRCFGIKKADRRIVLITNFASQVMMRIGFVVFYSFIFWKYTYAVIVLELAVYVGEYLVYCKAMPQMTRKRRAAFVLCANTASLLVGSIFNYYILFA